ncbi:hypothetical protein NDU88_000097 [Pleurodeles waltl]|uniref:L1 transposable element RRM domain-containing protein n=1 Tax=Pleurodeles waltl TaxID=8319 RepID=A0AAV7TFB1_PLEWA|nr:hypothetical protein NDU88_000097 [Pleurodeles waltl]
MPRGKTTGKVTGKSTRQLLFSEALQQQKHPSAADSSPLPCANMTEDIQGATMDRVLQEISAVSRKLEGMDNAMVALTAETRSMRLDLAGFQSQLSGLDQRVATVETQVASWTDRDLELSHLRSKLTDLEDKSRRNNVRLLGFPEGVEGAEIFSYLQDILPKLTDITFDPPLEFQRAHRLGPRRQDGNGRPHPIIACMLRHTQARQLLQTARTQGLLRSGNLEIRMSADFSKETADRRKAFLSFHTQLRHLEVKFGLFEPARMWITKNGESQNFYDPEDLRTFLERLQDQTQSMEMAAYPLQPSRSPHQSTSHLAPAPAPAPEMRSITDPHSWGRDFERLVKSHDDRGQVLQAVYDTPLSHNDSSLTFLCPHGSPPPVPTKLKTRMNRQNRPTPPGGPLLPDASTV